MASSLWKGNKTVGVAGHPLVGSNLQDEESAPRKKIVIGAFTLVEILVVVTIITLLACLLLPAGSSLLDKSRGATCVANLRGIGALAALYTNENNNRPLPLATTDDHKWPRLLLEIMDPAVQSMVDAKVSQRMAKSDYARLFWCPSYVRQYGSSIHPGGRSSYGINGYFYTHKTNLPPLAGLRTPGNPEEPYILCAMPEPDWPTNYGANYVRSMDETADGGAAYLHGGCGNMLFLDGRVETWKRAQAIERFKTNVGDVDTF